MPTQSRVNTALVATVSLTAVCLVVFSILSILQYRDPAPYWDAVAIEEYLAGSYSPAGSDRFAWDVARNFRFCLNEHKPVLPMFLYAADHVFFTSSDVLSVWTIILLNLAIAGVLARSSLALARRTPNQVLAASIPCLLFWPANVDNLLFPTQVHVYLSILVSLFVFWLVRRADSRSLRSVDAIASLLGIAIACFAAVFSFGYGLVTMLVVAGFAIARRWPLACTAGLCAAFAATGLLYQSLLCALPEQHDPTRALTHAMDWLRYASTLLASPFAYLSGDRLPEVALQLIGLLGVAALARATYRELLPRGVVPADSRFEPLLLGLWALGVALLTGLARVGYGSGQALESRYLIVGVLFWIALALLFVPADAQPSDEGVEDRAAPKRRVAWTGGLVLAFVAIAGSYPAQLERFELRSRTVRVAVIAAVLEIDSELHPIFPEYDMARRVYTWMKRRGRSVFRREWTSWLGERPDWLDAPTGSEACGYVDSIEPVSGGALLRGWAFRGDGSLPDWIVVLDSGGRVSGFGAPGFDRQDVASTLGDALASRSGWVGYARVAPHDVSALAAVWEDGRACPLKSSGPALRPLVGEGALP